MLKELVYKKTEFGFRTKPFSVQSRRDFHPYPKYADRAFWNGVDGELRALTLKAAE